MRLCRECVTFRRFHLPNLAIGLHPMHMSGHRRIAMASSKAKDEMRDDVRTMREI